MTNSGLSARCHPHSASLNAQGENIMGLFNGIDLEKLFDQESEYGEEMTFDPVTDELIERAEKTMGVTGFPPHTENC